MAKLPVIKLSQKDQRWASKKLGTSSVCTIGSDGCLLTCVSMVLHYFGHPVLPDSLNDQLVRVGGFYQGARLVWGKVSEIYPDVQFDWQVFNDGECSSKPAPLELIDRLLGEKIPVIVKVDFNPGGELQEHWVLIVGKDEAGSYIINDPWTGEEYFFQAKYGDPKRYIFAIRCYRGKIPEEKYQLLKGGVILKEYEFNPEDKIKDLENEVRTLNEEMAKTRLEVNGLREVLAIQERDNEDLGKQLRETRNERDNAKIEAERIRQQLEEEKRRCDSLLSEKTAFVEALEASQARILELEKQKAEDLPAWRLIFLGIGKLLKKGG